MIVQVLLGALAGAAAMMLVRRRVTTHEAILEGAPDAMLTVSEDGTIRFANRMVTELFGYEPGELIGQSVDLLVPVPMRGRHPGLREGFLADGVSRLMG